MVVGKRFDVGAVVRVTSSDISLVDKMSVRKNTGGTPREGWKRQAVLARQPCPQQQQQSRQRAEANLLSPVRRSRTCPDRHEQNEGGGSDLRKSCMRKLRFPLPACSALQDAPLGLLAVSTQHKEEHRCLMTGLVAGARSLAWMQSKVHSMQPAVARGEEGEKQRRGERGCWGRTLTTRPSGWRT